MSRIIGVIPHDDYTLTIALSNGDKIILDMRKKVDTIFFQSLKSPEKFRNVHFEDKRIFWDGGTPNLPLGFTLDNILFDMRDE
ncbi:hypothetical protein CAFE_03640 [Caprobacter fermentans]|uniref:DUF2442 domain-containing protein n=1 Tax=Caproicibacter fermentans TaxID=2576756 RepID=A0A6N8HVI9_9FIRM|nr:DUF2442 domain-containing protein [Caproicibacter fermentans]MVB09699.1 hypothetical protein [Caproicibacter fermentans]OCN02808.1 hypothetical protein A7X67_02830 [Clostridium sp. W14A]QNK40451.1 DUF2442 domain-containing protein [Caproicibacter fermentans]